VLSRLSVAGVEVIPLVASTAPVVVCSPVVSLIVGILGLLVVEAGSLLVIASLRVQGSSLLSVKSLELAKQPKHRVKALQYGIFAIWNTPFSNEISISPFHVLFSANRSRTTRPRKLINIFDQYKVIVKSFSHRLVVFPSSGKRR
jgi:hypothetical protein